MEKLIEKYLVKEKKVQEEDTLVSDKALEIMDSLAFDILKYANKLLDDSVKKLSKDMKLKRKEARRELLKFAEDYSLEDVLPKT